MSWRFHAAVLLCSALIAGAIGNGRVNPLGVSIFVVSAVLIEGLSRVIMVRWFRTLRAEGEEFHSSLSGLPMEGARELAMEILRSQYLCTVRPRIDPLDPAILQDLPRDCAELFRGVSSVAFDSGATLGLGLDCTSTERPESSVQVGSAFDGAPLIATRASDVVFEWEGDYAASAADPLPSIFHWIALQVDAVPGLEGYVPLESSDGANSSS